MATERTPREIAESRLYGTFFLDGRAVTGAELLDAVEAAARADGIRNAAHQMYEGVATGGLPHETRERVSARLDRLAVAVERRARSAGQAPAPQPGCRCEGDVTDNGAQIHEPGCLGLPVINLTPAPQPETAPTGGETHLVADASDDPEHVDDCPGCETTLRDRIRAAVHESHLTQVRIAEELDVSQKHLSQMLTGRAVLTLEWAERIAALCGHRVTVAVTASDPEPGTPDDARREYAARVFNALSPALAAHDEWLRFTTRQIIVDAVLAVRDDALTTAQRGQRTAEHIARQNLDAYKDAYRALEGERAAADKQRQRAEGAEQRITADAIYTALTPLTRHHTYCNVARDEDRRRVAERLATALAGGTAQNGGA